MWGADVSLGHNDYRDRFVDLLATEKIEFADPVQHVDRAINLGLADFWGAHPWSFKQYEYSLTCSGEETDELPDEFESFRSVREEERNLGGKPFFVNKEDFDAAIPKVSWHAQGIPQMYTAYKDADKNKWYVKWYPQPEGGEVMYLSLYMDTPDDVSRVPNRFTAALDAHIAKFVYPFGTPGFINARTVAEGELKKAKYRDKLNQSKMTVMPDGTSRQTETERLWL